MFRLLSVKMRFVHAGVLSGASEELQGGYVVHNDETGIRASWGAIDVESGIMEYFVGIGTAKGKGPISCVHSCALFCSPDNTVKN